MIRYSHKVQRFHHYPFRPVKERHIRGITEGFNILIKTGHNEKYRQFFPHKKLKGTAEFLDFRRICN